ncbi:hypothetical protein NKH77_48095 [Streptomyces sp. M19]
MRREAAHRSPDPDAAMVFADRALVLDHRTDTTYLLALTTEERAAGDADDHPAGWAAGTPTIRTGVRRGRGGPRLARLGRRRPRRRGRTRAGLRAAARRGDRRRPAAP